MNYLSKLIYLSFISAILIVGQITAQDVTTTKKVNFGYSTNPTVKTGKDKKDTKTVNKKETADKKVENNNSKKTDENIAVKKIETPKPEKTDESNPDQKENFQTVAQKTLDIAKRASKAALPPTEVYKIGVSDVLFISLQNVSSQAAKYYTVLDDGTIDYPLAGELVPVTAYTTDEVEDYLREKIKLYENPEVSVKVREHASHKISVFGLVEKPGDKFLQREAIPLYVVRAEAVVKPEATQVIIKRKDSKTEEFNLSDAKYGDVLVLPGDIVEFTGNETRANNSQGFYYIGGEINSGGQMEFHEGITLSQAILASGGLKDTNTKKVVIRRKDDKGFLNSSNYNLKDIKNGKAPDPLLQVGDTIEIGF